VTGCRHKKEKGCHLFLSRNFRRGTGCLMGWTCMRAGLRNLVVAVEEMRVQKMGRRAEFLGHKCRPRSGRWVKISSRRELGEGTKIAR